jgi:hypothetical protein
MQLIDVPSLITAAGAPPKLIAEYVGRLNTGGCTVSIAHMISSRGWQERGQTPEFDEYTVVLGVSRHGAGPTHEEIASIDFRLERA